MSKESCAVCRGESWINVVQEGEVVPYRCVCFKRRLTLSFLGAELARAPHRRSELYSPELDPELKEVVGDRTLDDLFIKGVWSEVAQHLRWAVGAKNYDDTSFTFKLVDDEMLLRVYLGDFAYKARSRAIRDDIQTYNNLRDLVGECSLLIVRLGKLGHDNRAAANVLLETLNLRAAESLPTWLVEGRIHFGPGHKFYNDEVGAFIRENFETIHVGGDVEAERKLEAQLDQLRAESMSLSEQDSERSYAPETFEQFKAEPGAWEGRGYKKASKWRGQKRKAGRLSGVTI